MTNLVEKWLDWDGAELIPISSMPELGKNCDGDPDCENEPTISIRPYYLHWKAEEICQECYDRRLEGP